ncbi:hypothetical protein ACNH6C_13875 [Bdellovibrio bacteriovorus]|uniref:DUF7674 family protein n=1 Tax=Bdellovibrio bacteriovorus TaxID=959 RepID=UPI003A800704
MNSDIDILNLQTVIKRLLKTYPAFYGPIVKDAHDWIMEDGEMLLVLLFGAMGSVIRERTIALELDGFEDVFKLMEEFAINGDDTLSAAVLTGFMEAVFNYGKGYDPKFLACLLGPKSREFLIGWEQMHGNTPSWLEVDEKG